MPQSGAIYARLLSLLPCLRRPSRALRAKSTSPLLALCVRAGRPRGPGRASVATPSFRPTPSLQPTTAVAGQIAARTAAARGRTLGPFSLTSARTVYARREGPACVSRAALRRRGRGRRSSSGQWSGCASLAHSFAIQARSCGTLRPRASGSTKWQRSRRTRTCPPPSAAHGTWRRTRAPRSWRCCRARSGTRRRSPFATTTPSSPRFGR